MTDVVSTQSRPRILLADDHSIVAEALRSLLCDHCDIVGIVADGHAMIQKAGELKPDLIILDIGMPVLNGLEAAEKVKEAMPDTRFVFLTMMEDPTLASAALRLGPVGYVLKHSASSELTTAIEEVVNGRPFLTQRLRGEVPAEQEAAHGARQLTMRQREVLKLLAEGHLMKEIAHILQVSEKTVEFHKYQIMKNFALRSNAELVRFALKSGLLSQ